MLDSVHEEYGNPEVMRSCFVSVRASTPWSAETSLTVNGSGTYPMAGHGTGKRHDRNSLLTNNAQGSPEDVSAGGGSENDETPRTKRLFACF